MKKPKGEKQTQTASTAHPATGKGRRMLVAAAVMTALLTAAYLLLRPVIATRLLLRRLPSCNVILLTLDTLRTDHVSCYDNRFVATPAIDSLAAGGVVFENCIAQTPLTLPEHTTILSGMYPFYHQVRDNGGFVVPPQLRFISEILQEKGFRTSAFIASYVLNSKWGINQGFDSYNDRFDLSKYKRLALGEVRKDAADVLGSAQAWLEQNKNARFFAWIHLYDPHAPYEPPSPFRERYAGHPYRGAVAYMDHELGKFFAFLKSRGLWDNSLIIATGDHGESLGEHRELNHGFFLYESCLRVPLIVHAPLAFPASRVREIVEHVDLAPTLVDSLGVKTAVAFHGRSLLPLLIGKKATGFDSAYSETYYPRLHFGWSELKAYYSGTWKYILAPQQELYDWTEDRSETQNLSFRKSRERNLLRTRLNALVARYARNALQPVNFKDSDPDAMAKLHSLGYITATVDTGEREQLADPKDKVGVYLDLTRAREMSDEGRTDLAIASVEAIIASDPEIIDAYMFLGNLFYKQKDYPRALARFQEVLRRKPDYNFAMLNVINSLIAMKQWPKAQAEADRFLAMFPDDPTLNFKKATACFLQKDESRALEYFQKTALLDPGNIEALNKIGEIYFSRNETQQALVFFQKIVRQDPANVPALNKIGEIHFSRKEYAAAADNFARALAAEPVSSEALFNLGLLAEERGIAAQAEDYYRRTLAVVPEHLRALYNLAELMRKTNRYAQAIPFYRQAIDAHPGFNISYFMVAKYLLDNKEKLPEAIELCERGVQIRPEDKYTAFGYYILADIHSYLEHPAEARRCLERADAIIRKT